jgi:hypothetical protein
MALVGEPGAPVFFLREEEDEDHILLFVEDVALRLRLDMLFFHWDVHGRTDFGGTSREVWSASVGQ